MIQILLSIIFTAALATDLAAAPRNAFIPGEIWPDNNSVHINAHGGGILFHGGTYYWFGQHMIAGEAGNLAQVGVSVYSSTNLYDWKDEGIALPVSEDPQSDIAKGCILERPKVIFNATTGKFVMWFHLEFKGQGYRSARTGVAVADQVTGPYTFVQSFRPNAGVWPDNVPVEMKQPLSQEELDTLSAIEMPGNYVPEYAKDWLFRRDFAGGQMARDMTLFVDDDGKAYHVYASEENATLQISQLSDDYLRPAGKFIRIFPLGFNEAPSLFKHQGKYFLISSGCTSWDPNAARLAVADSIWGPWTALGNPCIGTAANINTTFSSQSTFVLPVQGKPGAFIFMADRWQPSNAIDGRHVWLPVQFAQNGTPFLQWMDRWDLGFFDATGSARIWGGGNSTWSDASVSGWNGSLPASGGSATIDNGTVTASEGNQQQGVALTIGSGGVLNSGGNYLYFSGGSLTLDGGTVNISNPGDSVWGSSGLGATVTANSGTSSINNTGAGHELALESGGTTFTGDGNLNISIGLRNHFGADGGVVAGIAKSGSGTLTLSGRNTYTGATTVNAGTLALAYANQSISTSSGLTINNGGTVSLQAYNPMGQGSGTTPVTINSGGLMTMNAAQSVHLGPLTLNGGELSSSGYSTPSWGSYYLDGDVTVKAGISTISAVNITSGSVRSFDVEAGGTLNVTGDFSNVYGSFGLTKTGAGTMVLSGANTYTGATTVNGGTLAVNGSLASVGSISVGAAGTLNPGAIGAVGTLTTGPSTINGILAIDLNAGSADQLVVAGNLGIAAATLAFNTISAPTAASYDLASYTGSLDATAFAAVNNLPSGYQLQFDATNKLIQLVQNLSAYDSWTTITHGLSGAAAAFVADPDGDGLANGLEWILGGYPNVSSASIAPSATLDASSNFVITFNRLEASLTEATLTLEYTSDLTTWPRQVPIGATSAGPDANGVSVSVNTAPSPDAVTVTIPAANAANGRIFTRLKAIK